MPATARGRRPQRHVLPPASARAASRKGSASQPTSAILDETGITIVGPKAGRGVRHFRFLQHPRRDLAGTCRKLVAVVAQSGAICLHPAPSTLGFKAAYRLCGGQIGCKVSDFITFCGSARTSWCFTSRRARRRAFCCGAARAQNGKTVVAVKIGAQSARAFALAHTGSLAGTAEVFEAFARAGPLVSLRTRSHRVLAAARRGGGNIAVMTTWARSATSSPKPTAPRHARDPVGTTHGAAQGAAQSDITNPLDTKRTIPTAPCAARLDARGKPELTSPAR